MCPLDKYEFFGGLDQTQVAVDASTAEVDKIGLCLIGDTCHERDGSVLMYASMSRLQAQKLAKRLLELCAVCEIAARQRFGHGGLK